MVFRDRSRIHGLREFFLSTEIVPVKTGSVSAVGFVNSVVVNNVCKIQPPVILPEPQNGIETLGILKAFMHFVFLFLLFRKSYKQVIFSCISTCWDNRKFIVIFGKCISIYCDPNCLFWLFFHLKAFDPQPVWWFEPIPSFLGAPGPFLLLWAGPHFYKCWFYNK